MANIYPFYPVKLVIGILISDYEYKNKLEQDLINEFGKIDYESELLDFTYSSYYNREMGTSIKKYFLSFNELRPPDTMVDIKLITNKIETKYSRNSCRKINLDPGYLFLSKFILTTTKDGSHRIPLHSGIYAEITLMYEKNSFRPVEWTYPDFKDIRYISILNSIRKTYKIQLTLLNSSNSGHFKKVNNG